MICFSASVSISKVFQTANWYSRQKCGPVVSGQPPYHGAWTEVTVTNLAHLKSNCFQRTDEVAKQLADWLMGLQLNHSSAGA